LCWLLLFEFGWGGKLVALDVEHHVVFETEMVEVYLCYLGDPNNRLLYDPVFLGNVANKESFG
jgi:hypothetical protein